MINIKELLGFSYYTSKLDEFLAEYDKKNPKLSTSQRKEIEKYQRIYRLRDNENQPNTSTQVFWEDF